MIKIKKNTKIKKKKEYIPFKTTMHQIEVNLLKKPNATKWTEKKKWRRNRAREKMNQMGGVLYGNFSDGITDGH